MPPGIGYNFQPGATDTPFGQNGQNTPSAPSAVRVLSLRVPEQGRSPVPLPLLKGRGGAGLPPGLHAALMALMGAFSTQPGGGGMPNAGGAPAGQPTFPSPNIIIDQPTRVPGSHGGTHNPEIPGSQAPGNVIPWAGGPFTPSPYPNFGGPSGGDNYPPLF